MMEVNDNHYYYWSQPIALHGYNVESKYPLKTLFVCSQSYPAQQDNWVTSLVNVWAHNFNPSTMVR